MVFNSGIYTDMKEKRNMDQEQTSVKSASRHIIVSIFILLISPQLMILSTDIPTPGYTTVTSFQYYLTYPYSP